ncbi:hypothetical protein KP509_12G034800 [Ceratopteris richardii]|uniref:Tetratricopeptide repeat protein n=1 Tax=Ceratopteris richardii TaxID=49495 RepID=A0A8T2TKI3_CERRI|nr:hypothetical protein KP509_12G034800 [Ceratopteris richardii]
MLSANWMSASHPHSFPPLPMRECGLHLQCHTHIRASAQLTSRMPLPKLTSCVLPLCLALLLARDCAPSLALADQQRSITSADGGTTVSFTSRVEQAISLLDKGRQAQAEGDFSQALLQYTQVIKEDGDLALSEYARVGRAIALYEVGDREEAFIELEDVSVSLKGYPEVHAALAAVLYTDKHSLLSAEKQFTIATLLDPHYTDLSYVKDTKHWPPSLVNSLAKFIDLQ